MIFYRPLSLFSNGYSRALVIILSLPFFNLLFQYLYFISTIMSSWFTTLNSFFSFKYFLNIHVLIARLTLWPSSKVWTLKTEILKVWACWKLFKKLFFILFIKYCPYIRPDDSPTHVTMLQNVVTILIPLGESWKHLQISLSCSSFKQNRD